jgi:hypothetical protein
MICCTESKCISESSGFMDFFICMVDIIHELSLIIVIVGSKLLFRSQTLKRQEFITKYRPLHKYIYVNRRHNILYPFRSYQIYGLQIRNHCHSTNIFNTIVVMQVTPRDITCVRKVVARPLEENHLRSMWILWDVSPFAIIIIIIIIIIDP